MDPFKVELSPSARFQLAQRFTGYPGPFKNQVESKAFRAVFDKLGMRAIQSAADRSGGSLSAKQASSSEPAAFVLTFDEAQILRTVANSIPRNGAAELALGPLVDDLDDILDGKERIETKAPPLNLASEDWTAPKVETSSGKANANA